MLKLLIMLRYAMLLAVLFAPWNDSALHLFLLFYVFILLITYTLLVFYQSKINHYLRTFSYFIYLVPNRTVSILASYGNPSYRPLKQQIGKLPQRIRYKSLFIKESTIHISYLGTKNKNHFSSKDRCCCSSLYAVV